MAEFRNPGEEFDQPGTLLGDDKIYNIIVTTYNIVVVLFVVIPIEG